MLHLLAVATAVGCATTLGALPILVARAALARACYDTMLGLGAGLMLAAATLGLLSEALVGVRVDGAVASAALRASCSAASASAWRSCSAWIG